jgi:hypothetical protein
VLALVIVLVLDSRGTGVPPFDFTPQLRQNVGPPA